MPKISKYIAWGKFFKSQTDQNVTVSTDVLRNILGEPLPASASQRTWWANAERTPQARAWMNNGYMVSGFMGNAVEFTRADADRDALPRRGRAAGGNAKKTRKKRRLKKEAAPVQEKAAVISLAIFGAGNLGSAIVQGIASSGKLNMKNIAIYDKVLTRAKAAAKGCKARVAESVRDALDGCEAVILAVKPQNMPEVLEEVRANLTYTSPLIISTAAGWPISQIELLVGKDFPIARIMPNINAAVGQSATVFSVNGAVTEEQSEKLCKILTAFGTASLVEESHFAAHLALSGAGPAFAYLFADALARAGVRLGLPREEALTAAIQTLLGSAENLKASGIHPQELVDRVCSPGGITIEGVLALEETGFAASVAGAVSAAFEKNLAL